MNRSALQDYLSSENFAALITQTTVDIEKSGISVIMQDSIMFDGILYRLEVIGEIAKNLSEGFKAKTPNIPWKAIARTRDILAHHYHRVDAEIIRKILENQIPELMKSISDIQELAYNQLDPDDKKDVASPASK